MFKINVAGVITNIILDPILIYGVKWGVAGAAIAFQRILFNLINIMLAKMIATFGADAVAAQKIGLQIESITYMVTGGLNGAVASFIGQNYGAKEFKRLHKGYRTALIIGTIYAALSTLIF